MSTRIANLFILFLFPLAIFSQNQSKYEEGKLFIRFEDGKGTDYAFENPSDLPPKAVVLKNWIKKTGANSLVSPFHLDNPDLQNTWLLTFAKDLSDKEIKFLEQLADIRFAERVPQYELFYTPNDPDFSQQWNLTTIQAENAWNLATGNNSVTVAIVDDAVLLSHQDLQGSIWTNPNEIAGNNIDDDLNGYIDDINGWDAADNDNDPNPPATATNSNFTHGTHVAGISGAVTDNNTGIASIGFGIRLMAVKSKASSTSGGSLQAPYQGIQYVLATGADVINMSWGGGAYSATYQALFDQAYAQGITCVAAAGNSNTATPMYPAAYNHVISVGATNISEAKASFSNYGSTIDVMAPGRDIYSTLAGSNSSYGNLSGTSMASPLVAGLAGLMISYSPGISPDDLELCLESSCDNINAQNPGFIGQIGAGRVNAYEAIRCLKPITADFSEDYTTVCPGGQVQFTDQSNNNPQTWAWTFQSGVPATSTQQNPLVTYPNPGTFDVTLIVTNANGADTLSQTAHIIVATPAATMSGGATILAGFSATIQVSFTGNAPWDFTYSDGTSNTTVSGISQNPYFFTVSPPATTTYNLVSANDALCPGTVSGTTLVTIIQNSSCNATSSYNRTYGGPSDDNGDVMDLTNDGGSIIAGFSESYGAGGKDFYVIKLDACGYIEWDKALGTTAYQRISAVEQTMDGGYFLCGYGEISGTWNNWLVKMDAVGNVQWEYHYGNNPFDYPRSAHQTPDGGYIIGAVNGSGAGANDYGLIKVDGSGNFQWANAYGGTANDFIHDVQVVSTGGYIMTGYRRNYPSSDWSNWTIRVDNLGNVMWGRELNAVGVGNEVGSTIKEMSNNRGYMVCGYTNANGSEDGFLIRLDSLGNTLWAKSYGGAGTDYGREVIEDTNRDIIFLAQVENAGLGGTDVYLARLDSNGNFISGNAIGGPNQETVSVLGNSLFKNSLGNIYINASTQSFGAGGTDFYAIKTNVAGIPSCDATPYQIPIVNFPITNISLIPTVTAKNTPPVTTNPSIIDPPTLEGIQCSSSAPPPFCLTVKSHQKISDTQGNFQGILDNNDHFGQSVSLIGDINGDGVQDLAVSAVLDDDGATDNGAFYILFMNTNGTVQGHQKISATTGGFTGVIYSGGAMGNHIEPLGDVNNDGIPDLALGIPRDNDGGPMRGAIFILFMNANGTVNSQQKISDTQGGFTATLSNQNRFGQKIANLGDIDGNGTVDLAVGAPFDDDGGIDRGAIFILFLNSNGTVASHQKISSLSGGLAPATLDNQDNFGISVTSIGDFDGNGVTDIAVGARFDDDGGVDKGAIHLIRLNANGTVSGQSKISDTQGNFNGFLDNDDRFGISVQDIGDLNGDGVLDLLVGAYGDDDGGPEKGAAYIIYLTNTGSALGTFKISETSGGFTGSLSTSGSFSWGLSPIGDLNNDGMLDLVIGNLNDNDGGTGRGAAWIIFLEDSCQCQTGNMNTFQRWYGGTGDDFAHAITKTNDGNLIMAGVTNSAGAGGEDFFVMKIDQFGNPIWRQTYGDILNQNGNSIDIQQNSDGGYLLVGHNHVGTIRNQVYIRLDPVGNIIWQKELSGSNDDNGRCVTQTLDGGFAIGGSSVSYGAGGNDAAMVKLDANGNLLWTKFIGGTLGDDIIGVEELPNGNLVWACHFRSWGLGGFTAKLICTDANGVMLWNKMYDGPQEDLFMGMDYCQDGGFIAAGYSNSSPAGPHDIFVCKTDSAGDLQWNRTLGGPMIDRASHVEETVNGGFLISGITESFGNGGRDFCLILLDQQGNLQWAKTYGGSGTEDIRIWGRSCAAATDGGAYMVGKTNSFNNPGTDAYLIKTDVCGNTFCNETDITSLITVSSPLLSVSSPNLPFVTAGTVSNLNFTVSTFGFADSILCQSFPPEIDTCAVVADFVADTVCLGDSTHFFDMSTDTGAIAYWEYDFGDASSSVGIANPAHLYAAGGSYLVTLISGNSCFDTVMYNVLVIDTVGILAPPDTTICLDDSVQLIPTVTGCGTPAYSFQWSPTTNLSDPNAMSPIAAPTATITYTVTITDANGNTASDQVTVTVNQACCTSHADIIGDSLVCIGQSLQLFDNSQAHNNPIYTWDFGPGAVPGSFIGQNPPPIQFNNLGVQQVMLILNDDCGLDTAWFNVYVNPLPYANAGTDSIICTADSFMIGDSSVTYHSYQWSPTSGLSDPTISNPFATILNDITYYLTVTDDITGCSQVDSIHIYINPTPVITLPQDTVVCAGSNFLIVPQVSFVSNYQWQDGSSNNTFAATTTGWYWVIGSNTCSSDTDSIYVTFVPAPLVNLGNDQNLCQGDTVVLNANAQNYNSLLWSDNSTGTTLTVTTSGIYWVEAENPQCGAVRDSVLINFIQNASISLPPDTTLCAGSSLTITAVDTNVTNYQWQDGSSNNSFSPTADGWYWVIGSNPCSSDTDSIYVNFIPAPIVDLGPDQVACEGDVIALNANAQNHNSLVWNDNSTGNTLAVISGGIYWVEAENAQCGTVRDSVSITYTQIPTISLPADTQICANSSLNLVPVLGVPANLLWQDGSTGSNYLVQTPGLYWAIASNTCGSDTDSVSVQIAPELSITLGADTTICEDDTLFLSPGLGFTTYLWQDGSGNATYPVQTAGFYNVLVTDSNGCSGTAQRQIWTEYCLVGLYVPNAFSPNGDSRNETFLIVENGVTLENLVIFDRWGALIYEANSVNDPWDGNYHGQPTQESVYVWVIKFRDQFGELRTMKGTVTILR